MIKLWGGRFKNNTLKIIEEFTESISFDKKLYLSDIIGSIAHVKMLQKQKIITSIESKQIIKGLKQIKKEIEKNKFKYSFNLEDIHMHIENRLKNIISPKIAGKLHTARSRNDQVALDLKLYLKDVIFQTQDLLLNLLESLNNFSKKNKDIIIPGFTHLQHAQPIYISHLYLAYFQKFKRDLIKLNKLAEIGNECPLGAAAFAGSTFNIDRKYSAKLLKFKKPSDNSIDTVSDRDFILDFLYISSIIMLHFSQLSEELILWSSQEFNFIELPDEMTTGSSIMPNKKNPDVCELTRGKSAKVISNLNGLFILIKSLPLAYNRDLQEDKKFLFQSTDDLLLTLKVYPVLIDSIKIKIDSLNKHLNNGFMEATDVADYLASNNIPFREAHKISGQIVAYAEKNNKTLQQLTLKEFQLFSKIIKNDIFNKIKFKTIVDSRNSYGGTSLKNINLQLKKAVIFINNEKNKLNKNNFSLNNLFNELIKNEK